MPIRQTLSTMIASVTKTRAVGSILVVRLGEKLCFAWPPVNPKPFTLTLTLTLNPNLKPLALMLTTNNSKGELADFTPL